MKIIVTGGAGYIGSMTIKRLLCDSRIEKIYAIDLKSQPKNISDNSKLVWIKENLENNSWKEKIANEKIDYVLHTAFKIRSKFGKIKQTEKQNLKASENVFDFCKNIINSKLIYLSSIAIYGAKKENVLKILDENSPLLEDQSPYGIQKKLVEKLLTDKYKDNKTCILRLSTTTGPYAESLKSKFGLITILKKTLPFVIETNKFWGRQFLHEKDLEEIIFRLIFSDKDINGIFNIAPNDFLNSEKIAKILNKKVLEINPNWLKIGLSICWPISFGKLIPPNSWKSLVYPIPVSGEKIEKEIQYNYRFSSEDALLGKR